MNNTVTLVHEEEDIGQAVLRIVEETRLVIADRKPALRVCNSNAKMVTRFIVFIPGAYFKAGEGNVGYGNKFSGDDEGWHSLLFYHNFYINRNSISLYKRLYKIFTTEKIIVILTTQFQCTLVLVNAFIG